MIVDAYASRSHYGAHLDPILDALPPEMAGVRYGTGRSGWGQRGRPDPGRAVVVASAVDAINLAAHRCPVIYVEHGAGQSYPGDPASATNPSYSGGAGLAHVALFICPSETVAQRWRATYPDAQAVAVGCPRLDRFDGMVRALADPRRVVFTFHWDCRLIPETRSAWRWWREAVYEIARIVNSGDRFQIVGHAHPRAPEVASSMQAAGIPVLDHVDSVLRTADLIVADNTSVLYEACAVGIPTLVLNAPWYRRDVEHGLRFWTAPPGPQIDDPFDLADAIVDELTHPDRHRDIRERATLAAYGDRLDGHASARAAAAIRRVASGADG